MTLLIGIFLIFYGSMVICFLHYLEDHPLEDALGISSIPTLISGVTITAASLLKIYVL